MMIFSNMLQRRKSPMSSAITVYWNSSLGKGTSSRYSLTISEKSKIPQAATENIRKRYLLSFKFSLKSYMNGLPW